MFGNGQNSDAASGRLLAAALGLAAGVAAFAVSVTFAQTLSGGRVPPILMPLVICGALALGLLVASTASSEVAQPLGAARARRALTALAPLATLVAFFAYSSDPATPVQRPLAANAPISAPNATRPVDPNAPILLPGFEAAPPGTPLVRRPTTRTGGRPVARPVRRTGGGLVVARPAAPERPFVGPVAVPVAPVTPVAPPAVAVPPRVAVPRTPVIGPQIVRPAVTKGESSPPSGSRACPGLRRGWERSPQKPPPHTCRKK